MINKLLIANRGEIVPRIIRTCREMGIATVAVHSEADKDAPFLSQADQTVNIGPANPAQSYLSMEAIIDAARQTGADAVHPGYGFLSERGAFAQAVTDAGLTWVGPPPSVLKAISSKVYARKLAVEVGAEVTPGTLDPVSGPEEVVAFGSEHGYPLFLKLDKGGGGKGIERVSEPGQAAEVFKRACSIGEMAFGSPACYIETEVVRPRHIEVQFIADAAGHVVCLGERECSIQRRHQKIIEEALSPVVDEATRAKLYADTAAIVKKMGYVGAGTLEGLRTKNGDHYFMEVNARLQVEHPVSEFLTGVDIVRSQLEVAMGGELPWSQSEIKTQGHAIEARVYAEDPDTFYPSPGVITKVVFPEIGDNLRVDHALADGCTVPPYYDPMLAKVIAYDQTRAKAIARLVEALRAFQVVGVKTTIPVNLRILEHPQFQAGDMDTSFIAKQLGLV
ncbi:MAG: ATP-grasp domain-containing protein [Desulfarculaceae bacterium]|nr:ATP-grasp domain-containing protein [Desulfarculaceae bacterium]MCF8046916.1 ATP-grasp domain-containing protein [Desulfarculaceae bacterium]MCF8063893.1 ATP-grasp domain-containing protein [Desulfarculaceae bacterium]MCF8121196.1 ATP-grasp domain-containing protein [Desulfarculaceae bacterium]